MQSEMLLIQHGLYGDDIRKAAESTTGHRVTQKGVLMMASGLGLVNAAGLSEVAIANAIRRSRGANYQIKGVSSASQISNYTASKEELEKVIRPFINELAKMYYHMNRSLAELQEIKNERERIKNEVEIKEIREQISKIPEMFTNPSNEANQKMNEIFIPKLIEKLAENKEFGQIFQKSVSQAIFETFRSSSQMGNINGVAQNGQAISNEATADTVAKTISANTRMENTARLAQNGQAISNEATSNGTNPVNIRYAESHQIKPAEIGTNSATVSEPIASKPLIEENPNVVRNHAQAVAVANQVQESQPVASSQTVTVTETVTTSQQRQTVSSAQSSPSSNSNTTSNVSQDTNVEEPIRAPETTTSRVRSSRRRTTTTVQSQAPEPTSYEWTSDETNPDVLNVPKDTFKTNSTNSKGQHRSKGKGSSKVTKMPDYLTPEMNQGDDKVINPSFNPNKGTGKSA